VKRDPVMALLRRLEWRGGMYNCPDCGNAHRDGHAPCCELDALLNGDPRKRPETLPPGEEARHMMDRLSGCGPQPPTDDETNGAP
jgi:hypothetical protein